MKSLSNLLISFVLAGFCTVGWAQDSASEAVYSYDSPLNFGLDLNWGYLHYKQYEYAPGLKSDAGAHTVHLDFEWLPLQSVGKLGIGIGIAGVFGMGAEVAGYRNYLTVLPIRSFLSYRLEFMDRQFFVPFAKIGAGLTWAQQNDQPRKLFRGLEFSAGVELCLSNLDKEAQVSLDRTVGINSTYLVLQYSRSEPLGSSNTVDLSHEEYLAGLRFEM